MWGGDIDTRSVFPLAVESSVIWTISHEVSSLLAVEATARGRFALRLGRMLLGEGRPSRSGPGAIARPVALFSASRTFIFPAAVVAHLEAPRSWSGSEACPSWMKSSAASSLVFGLYFSPIGGRLPAWC